MDTYVALDLETTGFDGNNDQVIEIGAIRFNKNKIIKTFNTFINPGIRIPSIITHITGIKDEDVKEAPSLAHKSEELLNFIGNYPIVGHNIDFDVNFLRQKGISLKNPLYDTLQLSTILLPDLPSYSLDTLTLLLNIEHKQKHRALSDTIASQKLFLLLEKRINEIDGQTYAEIKEIINKSNWPLKELFLKKRDNAQYKSGLEKTFAGAEIPAHFEFTDETVEHFYSAQGPLSEQISEYEHRHSQEIVTKKILDKFKKEKNLVIEAGAGTGKTIAYCLASMAWAFDKKEKVIISTYSKTLQEQIIKSDIPLLKAALENLPVKTAVLKGRRNYLSLERMKSFIKKDFFEDFEVTLLIKILIWLKRTKNGDFEELAVQGKEYSVIEDLCCDQYNCVHENANYRGGCFAVKAKQKAEKADIIIVNHALLIQDAVSVSPLIPDYNYLIIDESHHLEKVTTDSLTISLSASSLIKPFEKLHSIFIDLPGKNDSIKEVMKLNSNLTGRMNIFFGLLGIYMENQMEPSEFDYHINLKIENTNNIEWYKVKESAASIIEHGKNLLKMAFNGADLLENQASSAVTELKNHLLDCENRIHNIAEIFSENFNRRINWIFKAADTGCCLKSTPINVGDYLRTLLYEDKKSIILTSATLTIDKTFDFIVDRLNLDESFETVSIPSHFHYPDQVKIIIPQDLPEPATEGYFINCSDLISKIIEKNGGRTLVLFTSKKALTATYFKIAPALKDKKINIYAQHVTGGRGKILEHFKAAPGNSAIFGTASFWQGIDLPGNLITCVIIQKLPFDPPDDPIVLSRSRRYADGFNDYQLPQAIMKFKQGFGRLIRSSKDKGKIIILDSRIVQKSYGQKFLSSLPEKIQIEYTTVNETAEYI